MPKGKGKGAKTVQVENPLNKSASETAGETAAATKIQARHRGNKARKKHGKKGKKGKVSDEEAATKIQARHRGNKARKKHGKNGKKKRQPHKKGKVSRRHHKPEPKDMKVRHRSALLACSERSR